MRIFELLEVSLFKNRKLIFFLLDELKQCVPKRKWDEYYKQTNCIKKLQWVLDKEVDLYYDSECELKKIFNQEKIAMFFIEAKNKKYKISVFSVDGKIFSFESSIPFRKLLINDIDNFEIQCFSGSHVARGSPHPKANLR